MDRENRPMSSIERAMARARQQQDAGNRQPAEARGAAPAAPVAAVEVAAPRARAHTNLDLVALRRQSLLTPEGGERELYEQYRMVKRPLIGYAFGEERLGVNPPNLVQVTSSVEGEGKTFTAFNLAVSIAMEVDFTVLLVDADLTRRSLSKLAGLESSVGLSEVLQRTGREIGECVHTTNIPRLRIIPSGEPHPRSTELLASDGMRRVAMELASRYPDRLVVFDSPPLLMDSQAATVAGHMGQVLVVVEAGRTSENVLGEALGLVDTNATRTSLLLNKSVRGYGGGYYGGY